MDVDFERYCFRIFTIYFVASMQIQIQDFNASNEVFGSSLGREWDEVETVLTEMPLHLSYSDQKGKKGSLIFDPVGTNQYVKQELTSLNSGWNPNRPIPKSFRFLGKDIDFEKNGLILEVQFSNYPFLLNNTVRSELFYKSNVKFSNEATNSLLIVTKANLFPASNSTLYFEQAKKQLIELASHGIFTLPLRLVGLFETLDKDCEATITTYQAARYSREIREQTTVRCNVDRGKTSKAVLHYT